jgi:hypothetical protein
VNGDLRSPALIVAKGILFFACVGIAAGLLFAESPTWKTAVLLAVLIWAAARSYYFLFYVLHTYVDPTLKYAGLPQLLKAILRNRR